MKNWDLVAEELIYLYIGLTLLLTVGLRHTNHEDEFHITTFFRVRFARGSITQYIGVTPFWLFKQVHPGRSHHTRSPQADLFELPGNLFDRLFCFRVVDAQDWLFVLLFIRGIHPVCGEPLFCFSANPDSLSAVSYTHLRAHETD